MSYKIQVKNELYHIIFYNEPNFCRSLEMKPVSIEHYLCKGTWIILLFAVWSAPDIKNIEIALKFVKKYKGKLNLGIRPFEYFSENSQWCPELNKEFGSPIWLYYKNGILKDKWFGVCSELELRRKIK